MRKMKKMNDAATLEFVQLMVKYKACERSSMEELFRTPALRLHVTKVYGQILDLIDLPLMSSETSLMRCASPPERVGDGWPSCR